MTEFTLTPEESRSKAERAWDIYLEMGGGALADWADAVIDADLFTSDELAKFTRDGVIGWLRPIAKKKDSSGLPRAGQTTDKNEAGQPIWMPRQMWLFDTYELQIQEHWDNIDEETDAVDLLLIECRNRFGRVPVRAPRTVGAT